MANTDEFGIELGFQDSVLFNRSLVSNVQSFTTQTTQTQTSTTSITQKLSQEGAPGFNFNNPSLPLGNNTSTDASNPREIGTQGLSNFSLGRVNGDLGFGGLVLSAGSESVNALLRALSAHRRIQILSRPQIRALDNQQAEIFSGQKIPTITGFTPVGTTGVNVPTVTPNDVGIGLTCIPRVTSEGQVFMQVFAQRSQYRNEGVPLSTDSAGNTIESPILDISRANTTISVQTGQTVVIGGLISTRDEAFTNKVPFLGDIPLIGTAFRYDSRSTRRVELLVFLTPRVIGGPMDEESIKEVEMGRLHYIESEAEEIHGPLRALPPPDQVFDENGTPWCPPGKLVPGSTGPSLQSSPQMPPPPLPKLDGSSTNSPVIHDPAVSPVGASQLRYTEEDDQPSKIQQAKAETISSKPRNQTKPSAKSGFKGWNSRN
ncbi:MAG: type II and III secretion system protein [Candidatus Saccharimonas sp.]|nr:type II and III secretion system protein [Planctomycetaceae bacterium]